MMKEKAIQKIVAGAEEAILRVFDVGVDKFSFDCNIYLIYIYIPRTKSTVVSMLNAY